MKNERIFPRRLSRRDFLKWTGVASAAFSLPTLSRAEKAAPVRMGSGYHTYELVEDWGKLPNGGSYGIGCGIVVDGKDRVYVLTRTKGGLVIFNRNGKLLEVWQEDDAVAKGVADGTFTATAHGLYWSKEDGKEFLYFTENNAKDKSHGRLVTKTDLKGNVLLRIGNVEKESPSNIKFTFDNPTDVAIAENGDIYVVDGYGSQQVHRFDKKGKLIKTIGGRTPKGSAGPNAPTGTFNTCHGVWISTLNKTPEVYIADRNNNRVEVYSLDLEYRRSLKGDVRNPCCFYQHKNCLYIPDLDHRVTIIDANDKLVTHLGDPGKAEPKKPNKDGAKPKIPSERDNEGNPNIFIHPHALTVDSHGDLYVLEWVPTGRLRKFRHVPQKT